jgi:hypothetical protein
MFVKPTLVLSLLLFPAFAAVPTPESHFGHKIGVDNELLDWDKVVTYFQALEKSSDRIKFKELGKTVEGRPQIAVTISSPSNIKNLDRYLDIQRRLSDPRKITPAEATRLDDRDDHPLDPRDRSRFHSHRGRVCLSPAHRGQSEIQSDSR